MTDQELVEQQLLDAAERRYRDRISELSAELAAWQDRARSAEGELTELRRQRDTLAERAAAARRVLAGDGGAA